MRSSSVVLKLPDPKAVMEDDGQACPLASVSGSATLFQVDVRDLALDLIRQGLCVFDGQQRLVLFNRRYAEMYDLDASQLWVGMTLRDVVELRYRAGSGPEMAPEEYAAWRDRIGVAEKVVNTEVTLRNGQSHAIHHEPIPGGGWVATFDDITERVRAEASIKHMAHHDPLTGLLNRGRFAEHLKHTLSHLRGSRSLEDHRAAPAVTQSFALLFLDLDGFKKVNDRLGHATGDALLQSVAQRIGHCLREQDALARLGGDEFAVLLRQGIAAEEQATEVARRIICAVTAPHALDGDRVEVGASVGVALCSSDNKADVDPQILLQQADIALYQAKARGGGTYCVFRPGQIG